MQNVTQEFKDNFLSGAQKYLTLIFDDGTVLNNNNFLSESMSIEQTLCDEEQLQFGKCSANVFKIKLFNDGNTYKGMTFVASIECGEFSFNLGTYKVESEIKSADKLSKEIVAYDKMYDLANTNVATWYEGLDFGTISQPKELSIKEIRDSLFEYLGIEQINTTLINDNVMVGKTIQTTVLSGLDVIQSICEINGVFGTFDFEDKFKYVGLKRPTSYEDRNFTYDDYRMGSFEYEDFQTATIGRVQIKQTSEDVGYGYGEGNVYSIVENLFTLGKTRNEIENMAETILGQINGVYYVPVNRLKMGSTIWLELGDYIQVTSTRGDKVQFPILYRKLSGISALADELMAKGTEEYTEEVNGLQKDIKALRSKTTTIQETTDGIIKKVSTIDEHYYDKDDLETDLDTYYNNNLASKFDDLQGQIDGSKQTYMGSDVPTLDNYPANTWDPDDKRRHVGSLYYDKDGNSYRFVYNIFIHGYDSENGKQVPRYLTYNGAYLVEYFWKKLSNDDVSKALADSSKALADLEILGNKVVTEYYTKTQTDNKVTDEIGTFKREIEKDYYTKAYLDDEYKLEVQNSVASEISQTATNINLAVKGVVNEEYDKIEVGAENLILNSEDMVGSTHFLINGYLTYQGAYLKYNRKYLVI